MWKIRVNPTQPDPTCNPIDTNPFSTRLKWPVFDPWPIWPVTWLTRPEPNPTRPFCHVYLECIHQKILLIFLADYKQLKKCLLISVRFYIFFHLFVRYKAMVTFIYLLCVIAEYGIRDEVSTYGNLYLYISESWSITFIVATLQLSHISVQVIIYFLSNFPNFFNTYYFNIYTSPTFLPSLSFHLLTTSSTFLPSLSFHLPTTHYPLHYIIFPLSFHLPLFLFLLIHTILL